MKTQTQPPAAGEAAHTPTPWHPEGSQVRAIFPAYGAMPIARCCNPVFKNDEANAAFIVRACNSHAALVAALEFYRNQAADYADSDPVICERASRTIADDAGETARAALAQAKS